MAKIATIEIQNAVSGELQTAELWDSVEPRHRTDLEVRWASAWADLLSLMPEGEHENSSYWDWRDKLNRNEGVMGRQAYVIECENTAQAVMLIDLNKTSRFRATQGESIVYVDYLQTAPWNLKRPWRPKTQFRNLGTILMQVAIQLSLDLDFDGRIGLHSLPESEGFYRRLRMTEFWRDPDYQCLLYFEITASQAANLLQGGVP